jgi:4-hydroxy-3-polyprenylbenzoate decarboxylase
LSESDIVDRGDRRWEEYGLADINLTEVDPNKFGYEM